MADQVPDIGEGFTVTDRGGESSYRVTGWMARRPPREPYTGPDEQTRLTYEIIDELIDRGQLPPPRGFGPDNVPLMFCLRDEAEYVSGRGVAGVIARVADITVTGPRCVPEEITAAERRHAESLGRAHEPLT
jgi:hypothetical protein